MDQEVKRIKKRTKEKKKKLNRPPLWCFRWWTIQKKKKQKQKQKIVNEPKRRSERTPAEAKEGRRPFFFFFFFRLNFEEEPFSESLSVCLPNFSPFEGLLKICSVKKRKHFLKNKACNEYWTNQQIFPVIVFHFSHRTVKVSPPR